MALGLRRTGDIMLDSIRVQRARPIALGVSFCQQVPQRFIVDLDKAGFQAVLPSLLAELPDYFQDLDGSRPAVNTWAQLRSASDRQAQSESDRHTLCTARGMIPCPAELRLPCIVCVLPAPVCP